MEDLYNSENKLSTVQELTAIQNFLAAAPKRDGMGIEIGRRIKPEVLGIWGYALLTSPTMRVSTETAIKFYRLSYMIAPMSLTEVGDEARVTFDISALPDRIKQFVLERHLTVLFNFANALTPQIPPSTITFRTTEFAPGFAAAIQAELGISMVPDETDNTVVMPRALLDYPLPQHNPELLAVCLKQCENLQNKTSQNSWSAKVHDAILAELHAGPTIRSIAQTLGTSDRTLTRRLAEEDTTFRRLLLRARLALARELLTTTTISVASVAWRTGYAEPASFIRAFKKEYGVAPGQLARAEDTAM